MMKDDALEMAREKVPSVTYLELLDQAQEEQRRLEKDLADRNTRIESLEAVVLELRDELKWAEEMLDVDTVATSHLREKITQADNLLAHKEVGG